MSTKQKFTREQVKDLLSADQVTLSKGLWTARWGFFYTHGGTAEGHEQMVTRAFPGATIYDSGEVWKAFKGGASIAAQSHWFVKFKMPLDSVVGQSESEEQRIDQRLDLLAAGFVGTKREVE